MRKITLGMAAAAAIVSAPALAGTQTSNIEVSLNVDNACTLTTGSLDFGTLTDLTAPSTTPLASGMSMTCTPGASANVTVSLSTNANGSQRRMKSNTLSTTQYVDYNVVDTNSANAPWPAGGVAFVGDGTSQPLGIAGLIPSQTAKPRDSYSDLIVVTVDY